MGKVRKNRIVAFYLNYFCQLIVLQIRIGIGLSFYYTHHLYTTFTPGAVIASAVHNNVYIEMQGNQVNDIKNIPISK